MKKLQQLKKVIQEAVPNVKKWRCERCGGLFAEYINGCPKCATGEVGGSASVYPFFRKICLADVLRAYKNEKKSMECATYGNGMLCISEDINNDDALFCNWNLKNSLSQQSPECINFLHELLVKKK